MAGKTGVSINWGGFDKMLGQAAKGMANTQRLMKQIGMVMAGSTERRFDTATDPEGKAWIPSKKTLKTAASANGGKGKKAKKKIAKKDPHNKTLMKSGQLRNTLAVSATPFEVHVGSNLPYARIHQLGGKAGRGRKVTIPARPYLGISKEDEKEIAALLAAHIEGVFK